MNELINKLKKLAKKEKKTNEFRRRLRIRGRIIRKSLTKNENIRITVWDNEAEMSFVVMKPNKEIYNLAKRLLIGTSIYIEGIRRFRVVICTRLKKIKIIDRSKQKTLKNY